MASQSFLPIPIQSNPEQVSSRTKCCKSGWRLCKKGEWKFLVPRGKRQIVQREVNGKIEKESIWIPSPSGPPCIWISIEQYQSGKRKRRMRSLEIGQICSDCGTNVSVSHNSDVCPSCQTLLARPV